MSTFAMLTIITVDMALASCNTDCAPNVREVVISSVGFGVVDVVEVEDVVSVDFVELWKVTLEL
jgi:hypothetical protein